MNPECSRPAFQSNFLLHSVCGGFVICSQMLLGIEFGELILTATRITYFGSLQHNNFVANSYVIASDISAITFQVTDMCLYDCSSSD